MAAENKTEFLNKGSSQRITIDFNDKKHILALGRDSPITAYCGGEFGINAQYPPPQTEPAAQVKTANPEYNGYSARLNRLNYQILTPRKCNLSFAGFYPTLTRNGV